MSILGLSWLLLPALALCVSAVGPVALRSGPPTVLQTRLSALQSLFAPRFSPSTTRLQQCRMSCAMPLNADSIEVQNAVEVHPVTPLTDTKHRSPKRSPSVLASIDDIERQQISEFVRLRHGQRAIQRILIANNGIAAKKFIMSVRRWAYAAFGDSSVIKFIVMVTPDDLAAQAEYIRLADCHVNVPGGSNQNNYANVDIITSIAKSYNVDAVWAGWGHASENPVLADTLADMNIAWIGPPSSAMRALGDKVASTLIAQSAGVHCVPWSGTGLDPKYRSGEEIDPEVYSKACVHSDADAVAQAQRIGFPIMIKASAGGGGKGIRKCQSLNDVAAAFRQVQAEVPNSPIFLMRLVNNVRHVEVQLLADSQGNTIAIHGRDCSIQRRHQKIIEEGPVVAAPPDIWSEMEKCAIRLAKAVGYCGAGTLEYLYDEVNNEYAFLELNPRLQVEHPVTELLSGVNLPAAQLQIAMGIPLNEIPEIRKLYPDSDRGEIDFDNTPMVKPAGHVIACRITAESPHKGFQPTSGQLHELKFESSPNVWGYFSISANGAIHDYADSQFGHVFAIGRDREEARKHMVSALQSMSYRGEISTTIEYLQAILETDDYKNNLITTEWLETQSQTGAVAPQLSEKESVLLPAALYAWNAFTKARAELEQKLERGLLTDGSDCVGIHSQDVTLRRNGLKYNVKVSLVGPDTMMFNINNAQYGPIKIAELISSDNVILNFEGRSYHVFSHANNQLRVSIDGVTVTFEEEIELDLIRSEFSGKLLRFSVENGAHLNEGDVVAEIECMKMHMTLTMPASGHVELLKSAPGEISPREVLVRIHLDDPSIAAKVAFRDFDGLFDSELAQHGISNFKKAELTLRNFFTGFAIDVDQARDAIQTLFTEVRNPDTRIELLRETVSSFYGRIHPGIISQMLSLINRYSEQLVSPNGHLPALPVNGIVSLLHGHEGLQQRVLKFSHSSSALVIDVMQSLFDQYANIEEPFVRRDVAFALKHISTSMAKGAIAQKLIAHSAKSATSIVIQDLLNAAGTELGPDAAELLPSIERLTKIPAVSRSACKALAHIRSQLLVNGDYPANYVTRQQVKLARNLQALVTSSSKAVPLSHHLGDISTVGIEDDVITGVLPNNNSFLGGNIVAAFRPSLNDMVTGLPQITSHPADCFYFLLQSDATLSGSSDQMSDLLQEFIQTFNDKYIASRPVTFGVIDPDSRTLRLFTFGCSDGKYSELRHLRSLSPPAIASLELERLSDLNEKWTFQSLSSAIGVFQSPLPHDRSRVFVRGYLPVMGPIDISDLEEFSFELDSLLNAIVWHDFDRKSRQNNVFLNIAIEGDWMDLKPIIESTMQKYAQDLDNAHISSVEIRIHDKMKNYEPARLVFSILPGVGLVADIYRETVSNPPTYQSCAKSTLYVVDPHSSSAPIELEDHIGQLDGHSCLEPYAAPSKMDIRRDAAKQVETLLPYDFLHLFSYVLRKQNPDVLSPFQAVELCRLEDVPNCPRHQLDSTELNAMGLAAVIRPPASNNIGMVGWLCQVASPSSGASRNVVIIANDITISRGSFGVGESDLFARLSAYARDHRFPRIYLAANSGARLGLAEDINALFKVDWVDAGDPSKGFNYLYLDEADYVKHSDAVLAEPVQSRDGSVRYRLNAVIGAQRGIGVENLAASGRIAGETSAAYDDTFTLSYVSSRSVGIGAYLVRLGHRVIQKASDHSSLLLTGYGALNQLLGSKVYKSNRQLGGVELMSGNGISNQVVTNDLEGVERIVEWLDFVSSGPAQKMHNSAVEAPHRAMPESLEFLNNPYDPLLLINGDDDVPGIFDKGSWVEVNQNWAKTVRCGHARLSGLNVGVIAVESRTQTKIIPADPVTPGSKDEVRVQPGCVLFPDSAYKVAQAINDFNREGLPTVILANWRGFSGGQRDMHDEVLKFGSMIVDALVGAKMPVIVYIPPKGELRGGAWVVVDRNINRNVMEMYADPTSRGGILEPAGTVEVKYRDKKLDILSARLNPEISADRRGNIRSAYRNVAQHFVDLHDRPERMVAVDAIDGIVPYAESRQFLYWRLRRLLLEHDLLGCCSRQAILLGLDQQDPGANITDLDLLRQYIATATAKGGSDTASFQLHGQDENVVSWLTENEQSLRKSLTGFERRVTYRRLMGELLHPEDGGSLNSL